MRALSHYIVSKRIPGARLTAAAGAEELRKNALINKFAGVRQA